MSPKGPKPRFGRPPWFWFRELENRRQDFKFRNGRAGMQKRHAEDDVGNVFGLKRFGQGFSARLDGTLFHQFRVDQARADDAGANTILAFFLPDGGGKAEDAAFRRLIGGAGDVSVLAGDGRDVNEMPLARGAHGRKQSRRQRIGAVEIHLHQFIPDGPIQASHGAIRRVGAGSENQDIDATQLGDGIGGERLHGVMGRGVGGAVGDLMAFGGELGGKFREALGAAGGGVDAGSGAGEEAGGGAADAAGGTDDEGSFPLDGYRHPVFISP